MRTLETLPCLTCYWHIRRFKLFSDKLKRLVSGTFNSCNLGGKKKEKKKKNPSSFHPKTQTKNPRLMLLGFHYGEISTTHLLNPLPPDAVLSRVFISYLTERELIMLFSWILNFGRFWYFLLLLEKSWDCGNSAFIWFFCF